MTDQCEIPHIYLHNESDAFYIYLICGHMAHIDMFELTYALDFSSAREIAGQLSRCLNIPLVIKLEEPRRIIC